MLLKSENDYIHVNHVLTFIHDNISLIDHTNIFITMHKKLTTDVKQIPTSKFP